MRPSTQVVVPSQQQLPQESVKVHTSPTLAAPWASTQLDQVMPVPQACAGFESSGQNAPDSAGTHVFVQ
jgi:hypothetical protein